MINFNNVKLSVTAGLSSQFPYGRACVALSGRSNVGKSSLLNTLVGRKSLAYVSSSPGKTVTINFYDIDGKIYLVDLPGYGYAKRSAEHKKVWSSLTDDYIQKNTPELMIQLIDLKAGATDDDALMMKYMLDSHIPFAVAATKCDKLNKTDRQAQLSGLRELLPHDIEIFPFSSLTGEGRKELIAYIDGKITEIKKKK